MILLSSGKMESLAFVDPDEIRFDADIAFPLSRIARYNGHGIPGSKNIWSVAHHTVVGVEAIMRETGSKELAKWFLLHDAHEAYIGDMTRPVQYEFTRRLPAFPAMLSQVKSQLDDTIATAAQRTSAVEKCAPKTFPVKGGVAAGIKEWD